MPLQELILSQTLFSDLETLVGLPLRVLDLGNAPVKDFSPLLRILTLEKLGAATRVENFLPLRTHPGLKIIHTNSVDVLVAEFWTAYDAQQAAGKK